jgi:methylated-DNA-protein-cysteine methyltransferase-like protein
MSMAPSISPPPLPDGDHLTSDEFLHSWEAMPGLKAGTCYYRQMKRSTPRTVTRNLKRRITKDGSRPNETRDAAFRRVILSIPKGKVATYGQVAAAAGYPLYHRAVARLLSNVPSGTLPWQRVVGAGGEIKLRFEAASEQRLRLELEGVTFRGKKINLAEHQHVFRTWELP